MNRIIHTLISIILLTGLISCSAQHIMDPSIKSVSVEAARVLIAEDKSVVILDVRTPEEHEAGHINGALNINIKNEDFSSNISKLDRNKTYIVHCSANVENGRTAQSLKIMGSQGFNNLLNLSGGIAAWMQHDYPLVQ